ncbi:MAG: DegV family protein [Bacilli bacterium]|nr:DegV family protein [Bacilli bacterium]
MKIAISAETTADLPKEILEKHHINIIPFEVTLGDRTDYDGVITSQDIFEFVEKHNILPRTSAINEFLYSECFTNILKDYDAVIHICLGKHISSSYSNAKKVSGEMKNVYVIDSASLSSGIGLLVLYAAKLIEEGKLSAPEIAAKVEARVPHVQASFVVNTIEYLYKGGRCSALQRLGAHLLRIKPQIVLQDGKLIPGKKYLGRNSVVIHDYCKDILDEFDTPDLSVAFVTHTNASPEMVEEAKKALQARGFKTIYESLAGATITSHCGPKTLGILYINDGGKA